MNLKMLEFLYGSARFFYPYQILERVGHGYVSIILILYIWPSHFYKSANFKR